jgi:SAM-dependent methyltransferase
MNPAEYDRMYDNEDKYWWYVSRRELVLRLLDRVRLPTREPVILDIGCGTGATAADLKKFGRVIGVDFSPLALERCKRRGLNRLIQAKAEEIPLPDGFADALVATDLIEHLDDDALALAEFHRVLQPGGWAVISVPAFGFLWSEHDEALMHRRRYVASGLRRVVERAGFEIQTLNYALCFLFPAALGRLAKPAHQGKRKAEAQIVRVPEIANRALIGLQRVEARLLPYVPLPFGLSVVAVLRKPEAKALRRAA